MAKKKPGPKPSTLPKTPSGQISRAVDVVAARADAERAFVVNQRIAKFGIPEPLAKNAMASTPIGRLRLNWRPDGSSPHSISPEQYDALDGLSELHARYMRAIDAKQDIQSPGFEMVSRGLPILADIDDADEADRHTKILARYADVRRAVTDVVGFDGWQKTIEVACRQRDIIHGQDVGILRYAANEINRLWTSKKRLAA